MNDLAQRCREILSWRRTGRYEGHALQAVADSIEDTGSSLPMREAEDEAVKEALMLCATLDSEDDLVEAILRIELGEDRLDDSEWTETRAVCERCIRAALATKMQN